MYVILVYDVDQKRTAKMLHCAGVTFHGYKTVYLKGRFQVQLKQLTSEARNLMDERIV